MSTAYFRLSRPESDRQRIEWDDDVDLETVHCPLNPGHQRAGKRITDLSILLPSERYDDIMWGWMGECLIQDRVKKILQEARVSGFETRPVRVGFKRGRPENPPPVFWELIVTGWGGIAPPESGIRVLKKCPGCQYSQYSGFTNSSMLIDSLQKDRSDIFMVWPLPGFIFISDRLARILRDEEFSAFTLTPLAELRMSGDTLTPGRLSYWMPEERAHALGEPLGIY